MDISSVMIIPNRPIDFVDTLKEAGVKVDSLGYVYEKLKEELYSEFEPDDFEVGQYITTTIHPMHLTNSNEPLDFNILIVNKDITLVESDDTLDITIKFK